LTPPYYGFPPPSSSSLYTAFTLVSSNPAVPFSTTSFRRHPFLFFRVFSITFSAERLPPYHTSFYPSSPVRFFGFIEPRPSKSTFSRNRSPSSLRIVPSVQTGFLTASTFPSFPCLTLKNVINFFFYFVQLALLTPFSLHLIFYVLPQVLAFIPFFFPSGYFALHPPPQHSNGLSLSLLKFYPFRKNSFFFYFHSFTTSFLFSKASGGNNSCRFFVSEPTFFSPFLSLLYSSGESVLSEGPSPRLFCLFRRCFFFFPFTRPPFHSYSFSFAIFKSHLFFISKGTQFFPPSPTFFPPTPHFPDLLERLANAIRDCPISPFNANHLRKPLLSPL